nr:hypothetical protein [Candidatus Sigynarchaeota archaeon]
VEEVRVAKDEVLIVAELALFVDKPDEMKNMVRRVLISGWPEEKKDAWASAIRRVLDDWRKFKPSLWQKIGKALVGVLGKAIGDEAADLASNGIKALWTWLSSHFTK